jgi:hypothetical protein
MGFGGSGGSGSVAGSSDVALNSPANQEVLTYDSAVSKWKNASGVTPDGTITTAKIVDNAVTNVKLSSAVQTSLGKADSALQTAPVTSVASKTGAVSLVKADVGLGNVDNTADTAKPVSTATQTALNGKANTAHTHDGADITTGTIGTARLPAATDTTVGVVELATPAEAITGTDTVRAVTPQGLKSAITASFPTVLFVDDLSQIPPGTPVDTLVVVRTA